MEKNLVESGGRIIGRKTSVNLGGDKVSASLAAGGLKGGTNSDLGSVLLVYVFKRE